MGGCDIPGLVASYSSATFGQVEPLFVMLGISMAADIGTPAHCFVTRRDAPRETRSRLCASGVAASARMCPLPATGQPVGASLELSSVVLCV